MDQAWFMSVTAAVHEDIGRIEVAMRVIEVAGANTQLERIDLVGDPNAPGGAVFDAPGGLVDFSPGQWRTMLVGYGERLHMARIIADQVRPWRPGGKRQIERWFFDGMNIQRHIVQVGVGAQH